MEEVKFRQPTGPSVAAFSRTHFSLTSKEGPSGPRTCQFADAWIPVQEPTREVAAPVLQLPARDATHLRLTGRDPPQICQICPESEVSNTCVKYRGAESLDIRACKRISRGQVRVIRPYGTTKCEATGSQCIRGGTQRVCATRRDYVKDRRLQ